MSSLRRRLWPTTLQGKLDRVVQLLLFVGLLLTIVSNLGLCTSACTQVHQYKFFGFNFELLGVFFFVPLLLLHLLFHQNPLFQLFFACAVAGAVGAEINFILVQKYIIGAWCPICLSIASTIGAIALLQYIRFTYGSIYLDSSTQGQKMLKSLSKFSLTSLCLVVGFMISFVAVFKPERSFAEGVDDEVPYFGNAASPVEVFIITDWFCPACKEAEPILDPLYPRIMKESRLYFIDYPVHPESLNFVPYDLSFMIREKQKYLKLRKALARLAKKTKEPTAKQVEDAIKLYKVDYKPLNFADVNEGMKFMEGIIKTFKVKATPTVVVANRKKLNAKKLTGKDINKENIMQAIAELSGEEKPKK